MQDKIFEAIKNDPANKKYTQAGIDPLYVAPKEAKILIVGQAPGKRAQDTRLFWNDPSGDNLRAWMGVSREEFYQSKDFAILPMDFYFPGKGKSGDLPPRKDFAKKWHPLLLEQMPNIELTLLVGSYATKTLFTPQKYSEIDRCCAQLSGIFARVLSVSSSFAS